VLGSILALPTGPSSSKALGFVGNAPAQIGARDSAVIVTVVE
jgi:hypothetical protein